MLCLCYCVYHLYFTHPLYFPSFMDVSPPLELKHFVVRTTDTELLYCYKRADGIELMFSKDDVVSFIASNLTIEEMETMPIHI